MNLALTENTTSHWLVILKEMLVSEGTSDVDLRVIDPAHVGHIPNRETIEALEETNLVRFDSVDALFADLESDDD